MPSENCLGDEEFFSEKTRKREPIPERLALGRLVLARF
jgi:hypothetical protein